MKAFVTVKRVIGYNVKIRVKADHSDVDLMDSPHYGRHPGTSF